MNRKIMFDPKDYLYLNSDSSDSDDSDDSSDLGDSSDSSDSSSDSSVNDLPPGCVRIYCENWLRADFPEYFISLSPKLQEERENNKQKKWIRTKIPGWVVNQLIEWMEAFYRQVESSGKKSNDLEIIEGSLNPYDRTLAEGKFLNLAALQLTGVYLEIHRLFYVTNVMIKEILASHTREELREMLRPSSQEELSEFRRLFICVQYYI